MHPVSIGEETSAGTRARVLFSRLLTDREYWELLHCDSVGEILARLKTTSGYARELADLPSDTHRSQLEAHLEGIPFVEAKRVHTSLTGPRRTWLDAWLGLYDAETLKRILRNAFTGHEETDHLKARFLRVPGSRLPGSALLDATDFDRILDVLRGTRWFRILREPVKAAQREGGTLFPAEMALDALTLTELIRASRALSGTGRGSLADLFGTVADLLNLTWTIRGRRYFGMGFEEMANRLLPLRHRVSFDALRRMGRASDEDELWDLIAETPYASVFGTHPIPKSMPLEKRVKGYLRGKALSVYRKGRPSFATMGAYLFLHGQQIDDIKMIIEDVRYGYDRRDAALYLARPLLGGGENSWHS